MANALPQLPPPPEHLIRADPQLYRWFIELRRYFNTATGALAQDALGLGDAKLSDLGERPHSSLTDIRGAVPGSGTEADGHLSDAQLKAINDGIAAAVALAEDALQASAAGGAPNKIRTFDGAGAKLDKTVSEVLDMISTTENTVLLRNATGWVAVPAPTGPFQRLTYDGVNVVWI